MTTDIKLNQLIEWTDEDRAKGGCPVPDGSVVTAWFSNGGVGCSSKPKCWVWAECDDHLTAYLVHSVPREPIVRWLVVGGPLNGCWHDTKENAEKVTTQYGGRVVKMVEEME
jgi:hypothetical protein